MKLYWSYRSLPEMVGLSRSAQDRAWAACRGKAFRDWRMWLALACWPLMLPPIVWGMKQLPTDRDHGVVFYASAALILCVPGALWGLLISQVHFSVARGCLLHRRENLCPTCGYDLRATPERCPECGAAPAAPAAR